MQKQGVRTPIQQFGIGSIGLGLTGAVSRPFMLRLDHLYKEKAKKAGMTLRMYERYVDDSNHVVIVPPPGAKYDENSRKVIVDENLINVIEYDDERAARVMTDIANSVIPGIVVEYDVPRRNTDRKMPI